MPPSSEQQKIVKTISFRERYFSFSGRIGRKAYFLRFMFLLFLTFAYFCIPILYISFFGGNAWGRSFLLVVSIAVFLFIRMFISICLEWRRFKDLNMPGYFALIYAILTVIALFFKPIGFIDLAIFGYLLLKKGTVGENKYGPDPLNEIIVGNNYTEKLIFWPAFLLTCALGTYMEVTGKFPFVR